MHAEGMPLGVNNVGLVHLALKRWDEALRALESARAAAPDFPGTYFNLALAYEGLGKDNLAIEAYQEFLKRWKGDRELASAAEQAIRQLQRGERPSR